MTRRKRKTKTIKIKIKIKTRKDTEGDRALGLRFQMALLQAKLQLWDLKGSHLRLKSTFILGINNYFYFWSLSFTFLL
jgi:hypothetical protein